MEIARRNKMKKSDLKQLIKPLVKECIHEVLIEEGLLSNVVKEVAKGMQGTVLTETKQERRPPPPDDSKERKRALATSNAKIMGQRQKMMDAIGNDAYNGVNLFEGTTPISSENPDASAGHPNLGATHDSGVDISSLVNDASNVWKAMKGH
jgi:hypothetical protein